MARSSRPAEFGLQPGAESEKAGAVERRARAFAETPGDERRLARRAPGDQTLVLALDHRLGAVGGGGQVGDAVAELGILQLGAVAGAHQRDGADHGEADRTDEDGEEKDLPGIDGIAEKRGGDDFGMCGAGKRAVRAARDRQRRATRESRSSSRHASACQTPLPPPAPSSRDSRTRQTRRGCAIARPANHLQSICSPTRVGRRRTRKSAARDVARGRLQVRPTWLIFSSDRPRA